MNGNGGDVGVRRGNVRGQLERCGFADAIARQGRVHVPRAASDQIHDGARCGQRGQGFDELLCQEK